MDQGDILVGTLGSDVRIGGTYLSPDDARKLATRINDAADEADRAEIPEDGIYRVASTYSDLEDGIYLRVIDGHVLSSNGSTVTRDYIIRERIGDIPEGQMK